MKNTKKIERKIFELHANICKTLSHPKRLEIIELLRSGNNLTVSELAERLEIAKANTSQHLNMMRQNKIVKTQREGTTIFYSLANPKIVIAYDALRNILKEQIVSSGKLLNNF